MKNDYYIEIRGGARCYTSENDNLNLSSSDLDEGTCFENRGDVIIWCKRGIPGNVLFRNGGDVDLLMCDRIHDGVRFENLKDVWIGDLTRFGRGVWFGNGGWLHTESIRGLVIPGFSLKSILNKTIKSLYE